MKVLGSPVAAPAFQGKLKAVTVTTEMRTAVNWRMMPPFSNRAAKLCNSSGAIQFTLFRHDGVKEANVILARPASPFVWILSDRSLVHLLLLPDARRHRRIGQTTRFASKLHLHKAGAIESPQFRETRDRRLLNRRFIDQNRVPKRALMFVRELRVGQSRKTSRRDILGKERWAL
jgi:hypothetical protein